MFEDYQSQAKPLLSQSLIRDGKSVDFRIDDEGNNGCHPARQKDSILRCAKLSKLKFENPAIPARSFGEFSRRIVKVDYNPEPGQCCMIGHDKHFVAEGWGVRRISDNDDGLAAYL